jgi:hypothetical protein
MYFVDIHRAGRPNERAMRVTVLVESRGDSLDEIGLLISDDDGPVDGFTSISTSSTHGIGTLISTDRGFVHLHDKTGNGLVDLIRFPGEIAFETSGTADCAEVLDGRWWLGDYLGNDVVEVDSRNIRPTRLHSWSHDAQLPSSD